MKGYLILFVALLGLAIVIDACVKPPNYPDVPQIEYIGLNKNVIPQGNGNSGADTLAVIFSFTDGDGDLGTPKNDDPAADTIFDVFLIDSRDSTRNRYRLPVLPDQGVGNGVSGEATIRIPTLLNICCTFPDGSPPCLKSTRFPTDTYRYSIQIRDRAGNLSNIIETEDITVLCN